MKKFMVAKFLKFKMVDSKPVGVQVEEYQMVFLELDSEILKPNESFLVAALIEKSPPSWVNFHVI